MNSKAPKVKTQSEIFSGKPDIIVKSNVISRNNDNYNDLRIGLYDIDSCIQYYFDNVIKPTVLENDVVITVPSIYGSPERWSSVQKDGYYRDKNGKIHCPIIMFKRTGMSKDRSISRNLDANFPRITKTFTKKYSTQNKYDAFSKLTNTKPTFEQYNVIIPDYVKLTYDCMIWTDYLVQLDKITEAISYAESSYWGDPQKFVFYATVSDFNNQIEVSDGQDRMVRCSFIINLNGYIVSDALQKQLNEHVKNYTIQTLKLVDGDTGENIDNNSNKNSNILPKLKDSIITNTNGKILAIVPAETDCILSDIKYTDIFGTTIDYPTGEDLIAVDPVYFYANSNVITI